MGVAAVIVHYANISALENTLKAVREQSMWLDRLLIVDNASPGADLTHLAARFDAELVLRGQNSGYAAAANEGIRLCDDSEYVLVMTHECLLAPDAVATLVSRMSADHTLGAVGPILGRLSDRASVWSAGGSFGRRTSRPFHLASSELLEDWDRVPPREVDWLDGAALLLRNETLAEVGAFDEGYFLYVEEVDLLQRMLHYGWRIEVVPCALAWQEPAMTPPYLEARNIVRWLRVSRRSRYLPAFVAMQVLMSCRALTGSGRGEARARIVGLAHGISGRLDGSLMLRRWPSSR